MLQLGRGECSCRNSYKLTRIPHPARSLLDWSAKPSLTCDAGRHGLNFV